MLSLKKKEVELMKVDCARAEMEMKIYESEENIQRLRDNILIQEAKMLDLREEIKTIKEDK